MRPCSWCSEPAVAMICGVLEADLALDTADGHVSVREDARFLQARVCRSHVWTRTLVHALALHGRDTVAASYSTPGEG